MIYTIYNEFLQVKVSTFGAELQSIKSVRTDTEYLWQGKVDVWKGRSPVLFPICGRLYEGKYSYKGNEYLMNAHGFAKASEFSLDYIKQDEISLMLKADEKTLEIYPFKFSLYMNLKLVANKLEVSFRVQNNGEEVMPFSIGGHPAFNAPFNEGESIGDYFVEFFPKGDYHTIRFTKDGFDSGESFSLNLIEDKIFVINDDLFLSNDSVFVPNPPFEMTLKSVKNNRFVKVSAQNVTHIGLWKPVKVGANFICIEPWVGFPDVEGKITDFETKPFMINLNANENYIFNYDIEVGE